MNVEDINLLHEPNPFINNQPNRPKWVIFLVILVLFLLIGGCLTWAFSGREIPEDPLAYDPITLEPKKPDGLLKKISYLVFNRENNLLGYEEDRINILLLGIGGEGHDGPFLTDTIIIASIKPSTGQIAMLSIPRDLGIEIPGYGRKKINHASAFGEVKKSGYGAEFATQVIQDTFNININYYVRVDFKAFAEIIDEVGGITVNIDTPFVDQMFPADNYEYQTVSFKKGTQTMDGDTALQFVRSRHGNNGEGSDFARAKRQQKVLFALKEKILSFSTLINPIKINNIKNSLEKHITTNLEFSEIMSFLKMIKELNTDEIITFVLDDSPDNYLQNGYSPDGAFILEPKSGNFDEIINLTNNIFETATFTKNDTPKQSEPPLFTGINIEIQNGTWRAGLASRMKQRLEDNKFVVNSVGNAEEKPQAYSAIYKISDNDSYAVMQALQQTLRIPIKQNLPDGVATASTTDILVVLGDDLEE